MTRHDFINIWSDDTAFPERNLIYAGNPSNVIWITKNGKKLTVGSMTDAHIQNCYYMLKQGILENEYWLAVFRAELDKRGIKI